jgi:two-component sensor histidine kinase/tetratricopeptide (TPR) repeat protein
MLKKTLVPLVIFLTCLLSFKGLSQSAVTESTVVSTPYRPASQYKVSWQRLLLQLSSTYYTVVKENQVDLDSSLLYASRSLGLSRLPVIAEGINDPELLAQSQWADHKDPGTGIRLLSRATEKKHLELLVLLGAYYAFQPDSYHHYKDSVQYFVTRAINESKTLQEDGLGRQALCLLGKMYVQGADLVHGDAVFNQLIKESEIAGDRETEARAFAYRGLYTAFSATNSQSRINYLQKAIDIYRKLNNPEGEVNSLTNTGYLSVVTFQFKNAYDAFIKALQIGESTGFPYTQYNTEDIAMITAFEGKFGEPLKYTLETIKTAEANHDSIGWAYFYNRLGALYYIEGGRDAESLKWEQKALDRFLLGSGDPALYLNLSDMVATMYDNGQSNKALALINSIAKKTPPKFSTDLLFYNLSLSVCYMGLKQNKLAEKYLLKAALMEKQSEALRGPFRRAAITSQFGNLYFNEGQYDKSKIYLERYLSDPSRGEASLIGELNSYRELIAIDSISHSYISGLNHYKIYTQLLDSNYRVSKLRQAEELEVRYSTEEKETQITLLNQKARLEQASLRRANMIRNITIAGILSVLIILGLLFRQNRLKQKNNNIITQKNELLQRLLREKEWLLKEVHHRVKNNLHTVICLLESQAAYLENDALKAIENSQHRIYAMSLIHQKLYQSDDVKTIDMAIYIPELIQYLEDSFGIEDHIHFMLDIEPVSLNIAQAIPLGLIINEAVTNSIKHAFPAKRDGEIFISFKDKDGIIELEIIDNGIGMSENTDEIELKSLGLELMKGLSGDIDATVSFEINNGTKISIKFSRNTLVNPDSLFNPLAAKEVYL